MILSGIFMLTMGCQLPLLYIISGGSEQRGNGNLIDLNPDTAAKTLRAWYAADVGIFKSDETVLNIPARPAKPVIEYDIATESYLNGNAPTADMEYRASTSPMWITLPLYVCAKANAPPIPSLHFTVTLTVLLP